jgi:hypothetical protein
VAILGVVPKPAHVRDALSVVVDEHVVQGNHALLVVAGRGVTLQPSIRRSGDAGAGWQTRRQTGPERPR